MPLLTVLSAIHRSGAAFLSETGSSVLEQSLPSGWELEWVVQEDGDVSDLRDRLPAGDERVKYAANGEHLGVAMTRNIALTRARGALLQNLDGDDLLLPGALTLASVFSDERIHWAVGQADDLLPDGSRKAFPPDLPFGVVAPGTANTWAADHGANWPIHCAGIMYRTGSVRAVGGWPAVPSDDDVAMFAGLSQVTHGWFEERHTWLYRQHDAQQVRWAANEAWRDRGRTVAAQRALAADLAGLALTATSLDPAPSVHVGPLMKTEAPLPVRPDVP